MSGIDHDERTSALGLFNTARSYWRSAEHLNAAILKVTHPQSPVTFLYCHAIELYLKAYLRGVGKTVAELKQIGHRVANLANAAANSGLKIRPEQSEVLSHIDDAAVAIEARYIVTGFKNMPTNEALSGAAEYLDQSVCAALAKVGLPVRNEHFEKPKPQELDDALKQENDRVLVHMFKSYSPDCEFTMLWIGLSMEKSILQYHLERAEKAGLVESGKSNGDRVFWRITAAGRRYIVESKLV